MGLIWNVSLLGDKELVKSYSWTGTCQIVVGYPQDAEYGQVVCPSSGQGAAQVAIPVSTTKRSAPKKRAVK
jgi:hypothetical protein